MIFYVLNTKEELVETIQSPDTEGTGGITALNGFIDEKIESYELLELVLPGKADGLENIHEGMTIIFEDISGWREYTIYEIEDEDSSTFETVLRAELASSELLDEVIEVDLSNVSRDPKTVLNALLEGTRYQAGTVDSSLYSQLFTVDTSYMNVLEALTEFASFYGAELRFGYQVDENKIINRFVNVYKNYGEYRGKIFEIDRDMESIKRTVNTEMIKTTIIPYSKEIEVKNEDPDATKEFYRVDISGIEWSKALGDPVNKPLGQNYLLNEDTLETWGTENPDGTKRHKKISMEFDSDDAEVIISMAWVQLGRYAQPRVRYEVDAVDLYAMTKDKDLIHEQILLGDTAGVKDLYFSRPVEIQTRLVEVERDLFDSRNNQYVFGSSRQFFSVNAGAEKAEEIIKDVEELIKNVENFQISIDGATKVFRGSDTPVEPNTGDLWFRPHPSKQGHTQMLLYTGVSWSIEADSSDLEDAGRLKFGIIDGAEINVINLIADNITGGSLKLENGIEISNQGVPVLKANASGEVEMNISKLNINTVDIEEEIAKRATQTELTNAINAIELKPGPEGKTAYEVAVTEGFVGTEREWIESLIGKQGKNGMTAYEVAVAEGFEGTKNEWLNSLEGKDGLPGQGVVSMKELYYLSTSKTEQVDGEWLETPEPWEYGKYLWKRNEIVYRNPSETVLTEPVVSAEWEAVNQLEIDGRNLITSFNNSAWIVNPDYKEVVVEGGEEVNQVEIVNFVYRSGPYSLLMTNDTDFAGMIDIDVLEEEDYTISFLSVAGRVKVEGITSDNDAVVFTEYFDMSPATFNTGNADVLRISLVRNLDENGIRVEGEVSFNNLKLEKQSVSSTWSPAPEDLGISAELIDSLNNQISKQDSIIKKNEQAVKDALIGLGQTDTAVKKLVNLDIKDFMLGIESKLQKFEFSDRGLVIRPNVDDSATKIEVNSNGIFFYNGSEDAFGNDVPVASIEEQELKINKGIFVESMRISGHSFDKGAPGHTQISYKETD